MDDNIASLAISIAASLVDGLNTFSKQNAAVETQLVLVVFKGGVLLAIDRPPQSPPIMQKMDNWRRRPYHINVSLDPLVAVAMINIAIGAATAIQPDKAISAVYRYHDACAPNVLLH